MKTRRRVSDLKAMVAGQGGDGSLTVVTLLSALLARRGFHMYTARDVASRIKGGHAAALLRGSTEHWGNMGDHLDLLVAFDDEAIEKGGPRLGPGSIVIFDASAGPPPRDFLPADARVIEIPFARLAVRDLRRDLFKNSFGFGVLTRVLSVGDDEAAAVLADRFARRPDLQEANQRALQTGLAYADEHGLAAGAGPWILDDADAPELMMIGGNEALALGFLAAGGRFYAGYPITPASEILSWLERRLPQFGGLAVQAEDELAAINMAIGAALTGTRAMTASSGPGIALMQEGVSHVGAAEIPLVVVDCQRSGPSTGMPTKPEQSDIGMVVHGGNGDFPRIVLAPGGPEDCYHLAVAATNLAQKIQGPVYLVLDQAVSQDSATVAPFDVDLAVVESPRTADPAAHDGGYRRYQVTADGVSPWAVPGTPDGMSLVTGNEHDEWGHVATGAANRRAMMDKRMRKTNLVAADLPAGRTWGEAAAPVGIIGIGMEAGVIGEAVARLAGAGLAVAALAPRTLWPVPAETIDFVTARERVYVVEHNAQGQLRRLLAGIAGGERLRSILKYDGVPFRPAELADHIAAEEAS